MCVFFFFSTRWWWKRMHNHASEKRVAARNLRYTNRYKWHTRYSSVKTYSFYKPKISVSFVRLFILLPHRWSFLYIEFRCPGASMIFFLVLFQYKIISHHFIMTHNRLCFFSYSLQFSFECWLKCENTNHPTNFIDSITCFIFKILAPLMEFLCFFSSTSLLNCRHSMSHFSLNAENKIWIQQEETQRAIDNPYVYFYAFKNVEM